MHIDPGHLGAIDRHGECSINTASDFIAQYTTRQEYKYAEALPAQESTYTEFSPRSNNHYLTSYTSNAKGRVDGYDRHSADTRPLQTRSDREALAWLAATTKREDSVSPADVSDILRRAAALLCKVQERNCGVVQSIVEIPFTIFTKQSIKFGIALWLGIINENPCMESRLLAEIAHYWEASIYGGMGVFSRDLKWVMNCDNPDFIDHGSHPDPFYVKQEFAPSNKRYLSDQQQAAHDSIAPHLRILQFFSSHFNATRLGSPHVQRVFERLALITLRGLQECTGHPLAREFYFRATLFGLSVLRYTKSQDVMNRWRLKDAVLSAALRWFSFQPKYEVPR